MNILCFPHAGYGGPYRSWSRAVWQGVTFHHVEYPGHVWTIRESPVRDMAELVGTLQTRLRPLTAEPYAVFGHSMGALVAFEFVRAAQRDGQRLPHLLVVTGARPPHDQTRERPISHLPTPEFFAQVQRYGGIPEEVADNQELLEMIEPVVRADFALVERYQSAGAEPPLAVPIVACTGTDDSDIPPSALEGWRDCTTRPVECYSCAGGHFFIEREGFVSDLVGWVLERRAPR